MGFESHLITIILYFFFSFAYGHNEELGDKIPWFNPKQLKYREQSSAYYIDNNSRHTSEFEAYWRERTRRRLAGEANWWNFQEWS